MIKKIISISLALLIVLSLAVVPTSAAGNQYLIDNFESGNVGRVNQTAGDGYYISSSASGLLVNPTKKVSSNGISVESRTGYGASTGLVMEVGPSGGEAFVTSKSISIPYDEEKANTVVLSYKLKFLSLPKSTSGKWLGLAHDYKASNYFNVGYSPIQVTKENKLVDRTSQGTASINTNEWYTVVAEVVPTASGKRLAAAYVLDEDGELVLKGTREIDSLGTTTAISPVYINGASIKSGTAKLVIDDVAVRDYAGKVQAPSFDELNTKLKDGATSVDTAGSHMLTFDQLLSADNDSIKIYKKSDDTQTVDVNVTSFGNVAKIAPAESLEANAEYVLDFSGVKNRQGVELAEDSVKTLSFTTSSTKSAPVLQGSSIANGGEDIGLDVKSLTVTFDQEIDLETSVAKLTYGTDGEISANISATETENVYTVSWTEELLGKTTYTVDLSGVKNSTNPLAAGKDAKISFTTMSEEEFNKTYNEHLTDDFEEGSAGSISQTTGNGYYVSSSESGLFVKPSKKVSSNGITLEAGMGYNGSTGLVMEVGASGGETFVTAKSIGMGYGENITNTLVMTYKIKFLSLPTEASSKWLGLAHNYKTSGYYAVAYAPLWVNNKNKITAPNYSEVAPLESDKWYTVVSNFYHLPDNVCMVVASIIDENNNVVFTGSRRSTIGTTSSVSPVYINGAYITSGTAKLVIDDVALYDYIDMVHAPSLDVAKTALKEGATSVETEKSHLIVFDQLVKADSGDVKIYKKDDPEKTPIEAEVVAVGNTIKIAPDEELQTNTEYVLDFSGVKNSQDIGLAATSVKTLSFTTSSTKNPPVLKGSSIANGEADVSLDTKSLTVTFDQEIDIESSVAKLTYGESSEISATISATEIENIYTISWTADLLGKTTYTVDLSGVKNSTNPEAAGKDAKISFTTMSEEEFNKTYIEHLTDDFEEGNVGSVSQTTGNGYYVSSSESGLFVKPSKKVSSNGITLESGMGYNGSTGLVMEVGASGGEAFVTAKSINMPYVEENANTVLLSYKLKFLSLPESASGRWLGLAHDYKASSYYSTGYSPVQATEENKFVDKTYQGTASIDKDVWYTVVAEVVPTASGKRLVAAYVLEEDGDVVLKGIRDIGSLGNTTSISPVYINGAVIESGTAKLVIDDVVIHDYISEKHAPSFDASSTKLKDGDTVEPNKLDYVLLFDQVVKADNQTIKIYKKADSEKTPLDISVAVSLNRVKLLLNDELEYATEYVIDFSGVIGSKNTPLNAVSAQTLCFKTRELTPPPIIKSCSITDETIGISIDTKSVTVTFDQKIDLEKSVAKLTYGTDGEISATISATESAKVYTISWTEDLVNQTTYTVDLSGVKNSENPEPAGKDAKTSFTTISLVGYYYEEENFESYPDKTIATFLEDTKLIKPISAKGQRTSTIYGEGFDGSMALRSYSPNSGGDGRTKSIDLLEGETLFYEFKIKIKDYASYTETVDLTTGEISLTPQTGTYIGAGAASFSTSPIQIKSISASGTDQIRPAFYGINNWKTHYYNNDEWYTIVYKMVLGAKTYGYVYDKDGKLVCYGYSGKVSESPTRLTFLATTSYAKGQDIFFDDIKAYKVSDEKLAAYEELSELYDGATEIDVKDTYIISFNQPFSINTAKSPKTTAADIFSLYQGDKKIDAAFEQIGANQIKIILDRPLAEETEYTIKFPNLVSLGGNALETDAITFKTKSSAYPVGIVDSSLEISDGTVSTGEFTVTMRNRNNESVTGDIVVAFYSSDDLSNLVGLKVFRAQEFSADREEITLTLDKEFTDVGRAEILIYDTLESFIPISHGYVIE